VTPMRAARTLCFASMAMLLLPIQVLARTGDGPPAAIESGSGPVQSEEMKRLSTEIDRLQALYAASPKIRYISSSTRQPEYQAYLQEWRRKIELVGNEHYPEAARLQNLVGKVRMSVSVERDGKLKDVKITGSSGSSILDDAAKEIAKLASPFQPLPTTDNADVLVITQIWDFQNGALDPLPIEGPGHPDNGFPRPPEKPFDPHGPQTGHGADGGKIEAARRHSVAMAGRAAKDAEQKAAEARRQEDARIAADPVLLRKKYADQIAQSVLSSWDGHGATKGARCPVRMTQARGGKVVRVTFQGCPYAEPVRARLESALLSHPLPYEGFKTVFEPEIAMTVCFPIQDCQ